MAWDSIKPRPFFQAENEHQRLQNFRRDIPGARDMLSGMRNHSSLSGALIGCVLAGFLATACISERLPRGASAYVHVAANGVVTFQGEPVGIDKLVDKLTRAGARHSTLIKIVPQGDVSDLLLRSIAGQIGRNGLPRVMIMAPRKAVTIVAGQTVTEVLSDEESQDKPATQP